jgi:hypothetical protein
MNANQHVGSTRASMENSLLDELLAPKEQLGI